MSRLKKIFPVLLLLIPLVAIFANLNNAPFQPGAEYSDFLISHYSNYLFIQKSITSFHEIPLWSPVIMAGYPFHSDPLSGLLYQPGWLALLFPLPAGINLLLAAHIYAGGLGVYRLSRKMEYGVISACAGAMAFELMPKLISHMAAGHVSLIYSFCLTPWLFVFSLEKEGGFRNKFGPGILLGFIFLADPRWYPYALASWFLWLLFHNGFQQPKIHAVWIGLKQIFVSVLISLPLLIPLVKFSSLSTRADLTSQERMIFSLPFYKLLNIFIPSYAETAEFVVYFGFIFVIVMVALFLKWKTNNRLHVFIILSLIFFVLGLGDSFLLNRYISSLPFADLLRVPTRGLLFVCFTGALFYSWFIDNLFCISKKQIKPVIIFSGAIFGLLAAIFILSISALRRIEMSALIPLIFTATFIFLALLAYRNSKTIIFQVILTCIILTDLAIFEVRSIDYRKIPEINAGVSSVLRSDSSFRVYSPSYSIPQWQAVQNDLQSVDAVSPLQLLSYVDFMESATGVPNSGYSVTIPGFENGKPKTDNVKYLPDLKKLGLLNVEFLVSDFPIQLESTTLMEYVNGLYIYPNPEKYPRVWLEQELENNEINLKQPVKFESTNNWIKTNIRGPGKLYISQNYYPGWTAVIDDQSTDIHPDQRVLVYLDIPAGDHEIVLKYQPIDFYIALCISFVFWLYIIYVVVHTRQSGKL